MIVSITPLLACCVPQLDELKGTRDAGRVEGGVPAPQQPLSGAIPTAQPSDETAHFSDEDRSSAGTTQQSTLDSATDPRCPTGYYFESSGESGDSCDACGAQSQETSGADHQTAGGSCVRHSACPPGTYVSMLGTVESDVVCESCPAGTFSATSNASVCLPWSTCEAAEYEVIAGSPTADRTCEVCVGDETSAADGGFFRCTTEGSCPPGTSRDAEGQGCVGCASGTYCAGGVASIESCADDTWDHDNDPATACVERTVCAAGERVVAEGDRLNDRQCATCDVGTYASTDNAEVCLQWSTCEPGFFVLEAGSTSADRSCAECEEGHFSLETNALQCSPWRQCTAPHEFVSRDPSPTRDRSCSACAAGTAALEANASSCSADVFLMDNGLVAVEGEHYARATSSGEHQWSLLQLAGTSGGYCVEIGPDVHSDWTGDAVATAPRVDFFVNFGPTATYYAHVRGDAGTNSEGFSDSCYIAVDGVVRDWFAFSVNGGTWGWESLLIGVVEPGLHTLSILAREDGFRLDKVVVSTASAPPIGDGPPESLRR